MKDLHGHKVNEANEALEIRAIDEPGHGWAHHAYSIYGPNELYCSIDFQNGPINEVGVNGITHEALLAILEDRLAAFQSGPYACAENEEALKAVRSAQYWLQARTRARIARNVEGTHAI